MKIIEVTLTEASKADYEALSSELKEECKLLLRKLERTGKKLGIPLENKNGKDLRGYYKLYFDEARHRIVYTIIDEKIEVAAVGETLKESLEVVGIGKRDKELVYNIIHQRIQLLGARIMQKQKNSGLANIYKDYFLIGVATNPEVLSFGSEKIKAEFNSITCENEMKFVSVHPKPDEYTFERADKVFDFATQNNIKMRGHTLVWHHQCGDWLFENADKETLYYRMKEHIDTVVKRYAGKIYCWDVVNEAISDEKNDYLRVNSAYYSIAQSEEFIEKAFVFAHEADPDVLLFYNDYDTENPVKRVKIYKLLKSLTDKNIPIHGVGLQCHYDICLDVNELRKSIELFSSLGLTVQITELDVSIYRGNDGDKIFDAPPKDRIESQTKLYGEIFEVLRENRDKISGVTFWGLNDGTSWLNEFPVNRKNYPLILDDDLNPKDAYYAIINF